MDKILNFIINDPLELNLSYITFVTNGGIFIPTKEVYNLGDIVQVDIKFKQDTIRIEGKVVWITPPNALYNSLPGIGLQLIGDNAKSARAKIESCLNPSMSLSGYTCGITETKKSVKPV